MKLESFIQKLKEEEFLITQPQQIIYFGSCSSKVKTYFEPLYGTPLKFEEKEGNRFSSKNNTGIEFEIEENLRTSGKYENYPNRIVINFNEIFQREKERLNYLLVRSQDKDSFEFIKGETQNSIKSELILFYNFLRKQKIPSLFTHKKETIINLS